MELTEKGNSGESHGEYIMQCLPVSPRKEEVKHASQRTWEFLGRGETSARRQSFNFRYLIAWARGQYDTRESRS